MRLINITTRALIGITGVGVLIQFFSLGFEVFSSLLFWPGVILVVFFCLFVTFQGWIFDKLAFIGLSVFGVAILALIPFFIYSYLLIPLNYPPGKPFDDQLTISFGTKEQQKISVV